MNATSIRKPSLIVIFAGLSAVLLVAGCNGKVPTWGELTNPQQPATTPSPDAAPTQQPAMPAPVATTPAVPDKPDPQKIIDEFKKLQPAQVTNSAIAMLTSLDEGIELVTEIDATASQVDDNGVGGIQKLVNLKSLQLDGTKVTDKGCESIGQLGNLESLALTGGHITDQGVALLKDLAQLQSLQLSGTQLSIAGWQIIGQLPSLKSITIRNSSINDDAMDSLCNATTLERVDIGYCQVTDEGLRHLGRLENIIALELVENPVTCQHLSSLVKNKGKSKLLSLGVYGARINAQGAAAIGKLDSLEYLNIGKLGGINDDYFAKMVKGKKNLKNVGFSNNPSLTNNCLTHLSGMKYLEEIHFQNTPAINDQGLTALKKMKNLKILDCGGSGVTQLGIEQLKKSIAGLNDSAKK